MSRVRISPYPPSQHKLKLKGCEVSPPTYLSWLYIERKWQHESKVNDILEGQGTNVLLPIKNKCSKDHNCEELEFTLYEYGDIEECMRERSYKRVKGAIRQRRSKGNG